MMTTDPEARRQRLEHMRTLRAQGATYREIAAVYGITHQRVAQLIGPTPQAHDPDHGLHPPHPLVASIDDATRPKRRQRG